MPDRNPQPPVPGGDLELAVLVALWKRDAPARAREIYEEVGVPRGVTYTTVAKVLDRLTAKRMVRRRRNGRTNSYRAIVGKEQTQRALARAALEQFAEEDPRPAAAALLGALEDVSPELLDELEAELRQRRRDTRGA